VSISRFLVDSQAMGQTISSSTGNLVMTLCPELVTTTSSSILIRSIPHLSEQMKTATSPLALTLTTSSTPHYHHNPNALTENLHPIDL
jgi:hypothetical protein